MGDAGRAQDVLDVGCVKAALARLVDHDLVLERRKFGDDLPAGLAAHEDPAARPGFADPRRDVAAAPDLVRGQIDELRPMALARMDHEDFGKPPNGIETARDRFDDRARQGNIVPHRVDVAARAAKIELHIDHHERDVSRGHAAVEWPDIRLGVNPE